MHDLKPTVRSRELGLALMRAAEAKGLPPREIAEKLGWSRSKISRLYNGKRGACTEDVAAFLAICDIRNPRRAELLRLARNLFEPSWWQEYGQCLPEHLTILTDYEDAAIATTNFEAIIVPGLLQTESYMRALMRSNPVIPDHEIEDRVRLRLMRQQIFDRNPSAQFRFYLDEHVLARTGAGRDTMRDQAHHLLRMGVRPNIEIRVVPDAAGLNGGCMPFVLMEFTELNPVTYVENLNSAAFLEQRETITGYRRIVAGLGRVALDEERSRTWLARLATMLGRPRGEHDEHVVEGIG